MFVVATSIFLAVVAEPALPDNVPEKVVAVKVPVDGLTVIVDTEDVAAPETLAAAGVNNTGWFALVEAAITSIFLEV